MSPSQIEDDKGKTLRFSLSTTGSYLLAIDLYVGDIVLKYGGHIYFRELVFAEDDEQTGLTTCTIAYYY